MSAAEFPATFTAHAPSGPTYCCVAHARALDRLMQTMGLRIAFTRAPEDAECTNCVNEAAKARKEPQ